MKEKEQFKILEDTIQDYEQKLGEIQEKCIKLSEEEAKLTCQLAAVINIRDKWGITASKNVPAISTYAELNRTKIKTTRLGQKRVAKTKALRGKISLRIVNILRESATPMLIKDITKKLQEVNPGYTYRRTNTLLSALYNKGWVGRQEIQNPGLGPRTQYMCSEDVSKITKLKVI